VAGDRQSRFLKLERARKQGLPAPGSEARPSRFDTVERPGAEVPPPSSSGASVGRFQESTPALDVETASSARMPFVRCARCETDHGARATTCPCGADLRSPEQRAYNEALWQRRLAEKEREEAALAGLRDARAQADAEESRLRLEGMAALAREVAAATRRRLEAEEADVGGSWFGAQRGWALVSDWIRRSPLLVRLGLVVILVGAPAILLAIPALRPAGIVAAVAALVAAVRIAAR
jgi:hypothetical protein